MENVESFILDTFNISLLVGVVFLVAAAIMLKFPPKKINHLYGYRTSKSMKSQSAWDFAQRFSSINMIKFSVGMIVFGIVDVLFITDKAISLNVGMVLTLTTVIYIFYTTEKQLKNKFN